MKYPIYGSLLLTFLCVMPPASAAPDPAAAAVIVRKSCTENGVPLNNCFINMSTLTSWIQATRKPNATNPLLVEIGPGTFTGVVDIVCDPAANYTGYITFDGSGSRQTIFKSSVWNPLRVTSCTELNFSRLQITSLIYGGVLWVGGGNSNWTDVEVNGIGRAWYEVSDSDEDGACRSETRGKHYWFGSKLSVQASSNIAKAYKATCDESWFYGSEVTISVPANAEIVRKSGAISAHRNGIVHVYGSALRAFLDGPGVIKVVEAVDGGEIHIHGTGIDLTSKTGRDVTALTATTGGTIHANQTAYNPSTSGKFTRIFNDGGHIHAPYMWQEHPQPPNVVSVRGADRYIETDCPLSSYCSDPNVAMADKTYPHEMIYRAECTDTAATSGPWFDMTTKACRK